MNPLAASSAEMGWNNNRNWLLIANDSEMHFIKAHVFLSIFYITIPQVVLPLDVQNLYVLQEVVVLRKQAHIFCKYNHRSDQMKDPK